MADDPNVRMKWRPSVFGAIANQVNADICVPAAQRVAAAVSAPGHEDMPGMVHVEIDGRKGTWGKHDWASTRVYNDYPSALKVEAKYGSMARALGSA